MSGYRADIDGLRAVAVAIVVLFHAHVGPFTGGFVGVDVFFVISGYLIAGIIAADIETGTFSFARFYERRIRRLFPALFVVVIACTIAGYLVFLPEEFRKFGRSVVATAAFVSNYLFWSEAGYFDAPPDLKPLLHTWSLAVEEQFYLVFPALLLFVSRYGQRATTRLFAIIAVVSFIAASASLVKHPDTAFYLPHTRIWELLIGVLLVVIRIPAPSSALTRAALGFFGLTMIAVASVCFSGSTPFPGPAALLPCLGAALIIHTGRGGSVVHSLLARRAIVYVGLISYSLYLWHWPILVFARAWLVRPLSPLETTGLIVLSFVAADLSWRFVEAPLRGNKARFTRNRVFTLAALGTAAMFTAGTFIDLRAGIPARVPPYVVAAAAGAGDVDIAFRRRCSNFAPEQVDDKTLCRIGAADSKPTFLLWGDSHAYALASVVSDVARSAGRTGLFAGSGGCAPLLRVSRTARRAFPCEEFNDRVIELIRRDEALATVIVASRWALTADGRRYRNESGADTFVRDAQSHEISRAENRAVFRRGVERTLTALLDAGKRVVVVGPIPEIGFDVPTTLARNLWFRREFRLEPSRTAFYQRQQFVIETLEDLQHQLRFELIQPHLILCNETICSASMDGRALYSDDNHPSITGAATLRPLFEPVFSVEPEQL